MGGIHALEHAAIGIFPLLVLTDRNDLGGISIPYHPQVEQAAVFIYDGTPGGAGLCRQAFERAEGLLRYTFKAIDSCPCENGCPSCVHSPKCGSGNRPIDKAAAHFILKRMIETTSDMMAEAALEATTPDPVDTPGDDEPSDLAPPPGQMGVTAGSAPVAEHAETERTPRFRQRVKRRRPGSTRKADFSAASLVVEPAAPQEPAVALKPLHFGVFDIETQRSAQEVGGWHRADLMRVSCVVVYDSKTDAFATFQEAQISDLIDCLGQFELVVGFNIKRFDYQVLSGYSDQDFRQFPTLDLLEKIHRQLGYRLSLDRLAQVTLGKNKSADGLQALRWWKQGRIDEIIAYCKQDVEITRDLYLYGQAHGYLLFQNKAGKTVRVPVDW